MIDLNDKKTADLIEYFNISVEKAVYYEVFAAPKPGLVDSLSSGAHSDMNILKFVKSADVIIPFFTYLFKEGLTYQEELKNMLLKYRAEGLKTEEKMFSVTKGINTHKGLIFLMGLISFAAGYAYTQKKYINAQTISDIIIKITKDFISNEIENILKKDHDHSHGEEVYLKYGAGGARQEAVSGIPTILNLSLPYIKEMFRKYPDNINDIIVQTLIFLISKTEDTNILYRSDHKVLSHFKIMANEALIEGGILSSEGRRKIDDMKSFALLKNISPGGSADLVSCTLLIYLLECYNNKKYNVK